MADSKPITARLSYSNGALLAVDPRALGLEFITGAPVATPYERVGDIAVVHVCGPLVYSGWLFDTYEGIRGRVRAALADSEVRAVVMKINSPGGEVSGAFDCARGIRADANASGKPLWAFSEAQCCSAAYALLTAASVASCSDSAEIGSIGVIGTMCSEAAADVAKGISYALITSGARKGDGNPHVPLSDDAIAAAQAKVDDMAKVFFDLCESARPGLKPEALQAGIFVGASALARRLVDRVESYDSCLKALGATLSGTASATKGNSEDMPDDDKDAKAKAAKAEEDAKKAAASASADDSDGDGDGEPKDKARHALVKALDDATDPKAKARYMRALQAYDKEDDKEEASATAAAAVSAPLVASAPDVLTTALQATNARLAALEAEKAKAESDAFYASRPDLPATLVAELRKMPLASAKAVAATIPVTREGVSNPLVAQPARAATTGTPGPALALDPASKAALDAAMGLTSGVKVGAHFDINSGRHSFGVPVKA